MSDEEKHEGEDGMLHDEDDNDEGEPAEHRLEGRTRPAAVNHPRRARAERCWHPRVVAARAFARYCQSKRAQLEPTRVLVCY